MYGHHGSSIIARKQASFANGMVKQDMDGITMLVQNLKQLYGHNVGSMEFITPSPIKP